jgi:hypothetical protein
MNGLFNWNPFEKVPEIQNYLLLPNIDCVFLESSSSSQILAEKLRQVFPNLVFIIVPITEADGLLPQAAWNFVNSTRGLST